MVLEEPILSGYEAVIKLREFQNYRLVLNTNIQGENEMKKKMYLAAAIGFAALVAGTAGSSFAAQKKGDSDLEFSGGFFHSQGADTGTLTVDMGYGYYLTDSFEVGLIQTVGYIFLEDADDLWVASTIPYVSYYFRGLTENDTFQPFVGAFIGVSYNDDDATGTIGPRIGFKSYINDSTYVMVRYRYEWFFDELSVSEVEDTSSEGNHVVTVGIGFVF